MLAWGSLSAAPPEKKAESKKTEPKKTESKEEKETPSKKDKDRKDEKETPSADGEEKSDGESEAKKEPEAKTASIKPEELEGFATLPAPRQEMLRYALSLTERNLTYTYGSADPDNGGTDCSGFIYHVLQKQGHPGAPRQSNEMYEWAWKAGTFKACNGTSTDTFEFRDLQPGDLLFWVNSTSEGSTQRNPPVTHVMFYLGKRTSDGKPLTAGASDGRTYEGQRMSGVSVFDFRLPPAESRARFIGYARLPDTAFVPEPAVAKKPEAKSKGSSGSKTGAKKSGKSRRKRSSR